MLTTNAQNQITVSPNPILIQPDESEGRLDRYLAILMSAMVNENVELFEQPEAVELTFESLEQNVLQEYQAKDLRAAHERVVKAEAAQEKALRVAETAAQEELETVGAELQNIQDKLASTHADAQGIDAEFAPRHAELERQEQNVKSKADALVHKGETLSPEHRAQFERDVELALNIQLGKINNARAQLDSEHTARRQPYTAQLEGLEHAREDCARRLNQIERGAAEWARRVRDLHAGSAEECVALTAALRELLERRDRFPLVIEQIEPQMDKDARMDAISKRHAHAIKRLRLEMDAPANLAMARQAIARKDTLAAEKFIQTATEGGAAKESIEPLERQIKTLRRQKEIESAFAKLEAVAAQAGGWNRVSDVQRQYADELSRNPALRRRYERLCTAAKEGMRERGQKLERAVALMLRREGTEFAAKIKADLGKLTLARRDKKGAWFLVATGAIQESGQVKLDFWAQPKYAEDQERWSQVWQAQERARDKWAQLAEQIEAAEAEARESAENMQVEMERERAEYEVAQEEARARQRAQKHARREQKFQVKRQRGGAQSVEVNEEADDIDAEGQAQTDGENGANKVQVSDAWWRIYISKSPAAELALNRLEQMEENLVVERLGANLVESRSETYSVQVFDSLDETKARLEAEGLEVIAVEEYAV